MLCRHLHVQFRNIAPTVSCERSSFKILESYIFIDMYTGYIVPILNCVLLSMIILELSLDYKYTQ